MLTGHGETGQWFFYCWYLVVGVASLNNSIYYKK